MWCISNTQTLKASRATKEYICPKCSKFYRSKQALIDHAERYEDTMCRTSPLGSIVQEGQEVEITLSAVQNPADPYASGPGLSADWTCPRHIQSETIAVAAQTEVDMAEMEAPQLPTLDQGREQPEVCAAKEMIDVVGIKTNNNGLC